MTYMYTSQSPSFVEWLNQDNATFHQTDSSENFQDTRVESGRQGRLESQLENLHQEGTTEVLCSATHVERQHCHQMVPRVVHTQQQGGWAITNTVLLPLQRSALSLLHQSPFRKSRQQQGKLTDLDVVVEVVVWLQIVCQLLQIIAHN